MQSAQAIQLTNEKTKQTKHDAINNSISELKSVINRLKDLSARISNNPVDPMGEAGSTTVSLESTLAESPERIRNLASEMNDLILNIEEKLF